MRKILLVLRALALLGSLCLLFCVIAIKGVSGSLGWIIRVAPGVALLHTLYAVYHLCRDPTARTPASSASYMLFAVTLDAGLLPFLGFSAVMARNEYTSSMYGWGTLFGDAKTTWYIKYSFFLLCVIEAGLLLVGMFIGIYLAVLFRKIDKLPPDMNPLEPNLTARPHKRNKSELTLVDKHMSQTSLVSENRLSNTADPVIIPGRRVPFMHTRTDSAESLPFYKNNSARNSQSTLRGSDGFYRQSNSSFTGPYPHINKSVPSPPSRPQSAVSPSIATRQAGTGLGHRPARSSQLVANNVWHNSGDGGRVSPMEPKQKKMTFSNSDAPAINKENLAPVSPISSRASTPDLDHGAKYMEIKNWYESPRANTNSQDYLPVQQRSPMPGQQLEQNRKDSLYDFDRDLPSPTPSPEPVATVALDGPQNPLRMNPPGRVFSYETEEKKDIDQVDSQEGKGYALHDAPVNLPVLSERPKSKTASRPSSFLGSGTKGKYYGDLRSPVGSVTTAKSDTASIYSMSRNGTMDSHIEIYSGDDSEDDREESSFHRQVVQREVRRVSDPKDNKKFEKESLIVRTSSSEDQKGRVVSSTAHDLSTGYAGLSAEFGKGMGRRREVSGKVAEEGRMGVAVEEEEVKAKPIVAAGGGSKGRGFAAAGWARFRGL